MSPDEEVRLELMRQLKAAAHLQHSSLLQVWQAGRGLPPAAVMLLSDLAKHGEVRLSELAKRRMVDVSVVSRQIAQLSTAGLIDRRPAPEDGRASLLRVSARGEEELARLRTRYLRFMAGALGGWSAEKIAELTDLLMAMNEGLREALGPQVHCHAQPNGMANLGNESASREHAR